MDLFGPIIKRAIDRSFESKTLNRMVESILRNIEDDSKPVNTLELLALKSIMRRKLEVDDHGRVLFSLIFREPLDLKDFCDHCPRRYTMERRAIVDALTEQKIKKTFLELRKDPYIMHAVFEQVLRFPRVELIIGKTELIIRDMGHEMAMAKIPNRDRQKYDTYWAKIFFKLCLKKKCEHIYLRMNGEHENDTVEYMQNHLESVANSVKPIVPSDSWQAAYGRKTHTIYGKSMFPAQDGSGSYVISVFNIFFYDNLFVSYYWGYFEF